MNPVLADYTAKAKRKLRRAHKSSTIRFNAMLEVANEMLPVGLPYAVAHFPELQGYLPSELFTNVMRFILIANILYRFKTTKAVEDK